MNFFSSRNRRNHRDDDAQRKAAARPRLADPVAQAMPGRRPPRARRHVVRRHDLPGPAVAPGHRSICPGRRLKPAPLAFD